MPAPMTLNASPRHKNATSQQATNLLLLSQKMKLFASPNSHRARYQAKKQDSSTPVNEEGATPQPHHNRDIKSVDTEGIGVSEDRRTRQNTEGGEGEPRSF